MEINFINKYKPFYINNENMNSTSTASSKKDE